MEITKTVKFPIYGYTVELVKTRDVGASRKKRNKIYGYDENTTEYTAMHLYNFSVAKSCVIFPEFAPLGTIVHECFHAIYRMHEFVGAKLDNESVAYHLDYLVNKADQLNNRRIKTK